MKIKLLALLVVLVFSSELQSAATPDAHTSGKVILLNGTSRAGKSSIARELSKLFGSESCIIEIDAIAYNLAQSKVQGKGIEVLQDKGLLDLLDSIPEGTLSAEEINGLYPEAEKAMYNQIKKLHAAKKIVIVDTVLEGKQDIDECKKQLHECDLIPVLIYCTPSVLVQRVQERNRTGREPRSVELPLEQYCDLYEVSTTIQDSSLDILKEVETLRLMEQIDFTQLDEEAGREFKKAFDKFCERYFPSSERGNHLEKGVNAVCSQFYNYTVDTGQKSSEQCALDIYHLIK